MELPVIEYYNEKEIIGKNQFLKDERVLKAKKIIEENNINSCLFIFSKTFFEDFKEHLGPVYDFGNAGTINRVYMYDKKFLIVSCSLGAPFAAGIMDEIGFMGVKNFVACGSAGQIDKNLDGRKFVLVNKAIRDEGTSYKYIEPSLYVETDKELTSRLADYLSKNNFDYCEATTWTTDAFFRETHSACEKRSEQGAVCVEMECASWSAVAKMRGFKFAQVLYFSDVVKQEAWDWKIDKHELCNIINQLMIDFMLENNGRL